MQTTITSGKVEVRLWEKGSARRAYMNNNAAVRNKQAMGYVDLVSGEVVAGHCHYLGSIETILANNGLSLEEIKSRMEVK